MNKKKIKLSLIDVPIFSKLNQSDLDIVQPHLQHVGFSANECIVKQGHKSENIYVISSGKVSVLLRLPGLTEKKVAELGRGDFFGEVAAIGDVEHTASVTAKTEVHCFILNRNSLYLFNISRRDIYHKITLSIALIVAKRLHHIYDEFKKKQKSNSFVKIRLLKKSTRITNKLMMKKIKHYIPLLQKFSTFSIMNKSEIEFIINYAEVIRANKNTIIYNISDPGDSIFIVVQGGVQITLKRYNKLKKLSIVGPGMILGQDTFISEQSRKSMCISRENVILLKVSRDILTKIHNTNIEIWYKFYDILVKSLINRMISANRQLIRVNT